MSPALTRRIIDFFEYKTSSTRSIMSLHALEELPYQLQVMLYIQLHKGLITRCPIFQPLPELAVMEMMRLKPEGCTLPATLIIQEGTVSHRLYFISEGVVDVWHNFESPTQRTKISTLTKNGFFGEQSLMQERTRSLANATVQTVSFCDVLILSGDDFDEVLYIHMKYNPVKAQQAAAGATGLSGPSPNQSKTSCSRTSYSKTSSLGNRPAQAAVSRQPRDKNAEHGCPGARGHAKRAPVPSQQPGKCTPNASHLEARNRRCDARLDVQKMVER